MADDPLIVAALQPFETLSPRHAAYLMFQVMWVATLLAMYLVTLGGRWRTAVVAVVALALLGETHHLVRAAFTLKYNSGLWTVWPMPVVGVWMLLQQRAA